MSDKMTVERAEYARCVEYVQAGSLCVNDTLYAVGGVSQFQKPTPAPVNAKYGAGASVEYVEFQKPTPEPAPAATVEPSAPPIPGETTVFVGFNPRVRPGAVGSSEEGTVLTKKDADVAGLEKQQALLDFFESTIATVHAEQAALTATDFPMADQIAERMKSAPPISGETAVAVACIAPSSVAQVDSVIFWTDSRGNVVRIPTDKATTAVAVAKEPHLTDADNAVPFTEGLEIARLHSEFDLLNIACAELQTELVCAHQMIFHLNAQREELSRVNEIAGAAAMLYRDKIAALEIELAKTEKTAPPPPPNPFREPSDDRRMMGGRFW